MTLASSSTALQAISEARTLRDEMGAVAGQVAQVALRWGGDEAAAEQAMAEQVGNPFRIFDIGYAAGHGFDVIGVGDQEFEVAL